MKDSDLYDDTIIVTSDHGFHPGEHNIWVKRANFEMSNQVLQVYAVVLGQQANWWNMWTTFQQLFILLT